MCGKLRVLAVLAMLAVLGPIPASGHPKIDKVILENGDVLTCEIKEMDKGKLTAKTDRLGTVEIEWDGIVGIESIFYYLVETTWGKRHYGALRMGEDGLLHVGAEAGLTSLPRDDVVAIRAIETSFWSQQDGSLSFGFSFTKASDVAQLTLDWANAYRTERNLVDLRATTIITDKGDTTMTARREDFSLTYTRLLKRKWTGTTNVGVQRNDELSLGRRVIFGFSTGASPVKNNTNVLRFSVGVAMNNERATGADTTTASGEATVSANYSLFRYQTPKSDITTSLTYFPSLTEEGRYRIDFDLKLRHELIKDFFIDLSYYTNFDSQSPGTGEESKDLGIVTSLGYSY